MKKTLIFTVFIISWLGFTQDKFTISGTLKDQANGETLLGATIFLKGTSIGTTTNEYGFYSLNAPKGNYTLVISYLGYKTIEEAIVLDKNIKIQF